jgi:hypothetical protein
MGLGRAGAGRLSVHSRVLCPAPNGVGVRPKQTPRAGVQIHYMKNTLLSLAAVLLFSGYSGQSQSSPTSDAPQFRIGAGDVAKMSKKLIVGDPSIPGQSEYRVQLGLSSARAADFQKFTKLHLNQKVQIVLGTNVVAEPIIRAEITDGKIVLNCPPGEIKKITEPFPKK